MGRATGGPISAAELASAPTELLDGARAGRRRARPGVSRARPRGSSTRPASGSRLAGDHTVVALAGATGSGKSSLFNALVGADVATDRRAPTDDVAADGRVWGDGDAAALLDWLGVAARHVVAPPVGRRSDAAAAPSRPWIARRPGAARPARLRLARARAPPRGRAGARARRRLRLGDRPAEVRRRRGCTTSSCSLLRQPRRRDARGAQPGRPADPSDRGAACAEDLRRLLAEDGVSRRQGDRHVGAHRRRHRRARAASGQCRCGDSRLATAPGRRRRAVAGRAAVRRRRRRGRPWARSARRDRAGARARRRGRCPDRARRRRARLPSRGVRAHRAGCSPAGPQGFAPTRCAGCASTAPGPAPTPWSSGADVRACSARSSIPAPTPVDARRPSTVATRASCASASDGLPPRWAAGGRGRRRPAATDAPRRARPSRHRHRPRRDRRPAWWRVVNVVQWLLGRGRSLGLVWLPCCWPSALPAAAAARDPARSASCRCPRSCSSSACCSGSGSGSCRGRRVARPGRRRCAGEGEARLRAGIARWPTRLSSPGGGRAGRATRDRERWTRRLERATSRLSRSADGPQARDPRRSRPQSGAGRLSGDRARQAASQSAARTAVRRSRRLT